ncbi:hypothetical protein HNR26_003859 [Rhizobium rosettiformans]|uniref:Uncharacterized protein n=2 Tax=Rhizobium rosettiformans TaxID=1368430 RepID=A0A4S8PPI6_9HYPH|nr:hypothetical protein [Rhizobium rosettiformans]MBB5277770.1 hypothetical protein [Rhizobium rosettiformans]THV32933.1 hypothetical protein FAA86_18760 [Rhizobium rosettiformans W3]
MSIKVSAVRYPIDAANIVRAESAGAVTAATVTESRALGKLAAYWNADELAMPEYVALVIFVTAKETVDGDEKYAASVEVAADEAFTTATTVVSVPDLKLGQNVIAVARDQVLAADADATHIRLAVTPSGTTPSIDFWAQLSPLVGR